jgi:hypothetical protein
MWRNVTNMGHTQKAMFYNEPDGEVKALVIADREPVEAVMFYNNREERKFFIDEAHARAWCEGQVQSGQDNPGSDHRHVFDMVRPVWNGRCDRLDLQPLRVDGGSERSGDGVRTGHLPLPHKGRVK